MRLVVLLRHKELPIRRTGITGALCELAVPLCADTCRLHTRACQPPACCTYRRRRAACPKAPRTAAYQPRACRTYRVPRTVAPQVPVVLVGLLILGNSYAGESVGYPESYAPANRLTALQTINPLNFLDGIISGGVPLLLQPYR